MKDGERRALQRRASELKSEARAHREEAARAREAIEETREDLAIDIKRLQELAATRISTKEAIEETREDLATRELADAAELERQIDAAVTVEEGTVKNG